MARRQRLKSRTNNAEREVIEDLLKEGWDVLTRGWPDLIAVKGKQVRLIEIKPSTHSGELTGAQKRMVDALALLGIPVEIKIAKSRGRVTRADWLDGSWKTREGR